MVIENMEQSLTQYERDEEECRAFCEGPFDQGWHPDFITSTASMLCHTKSCSILIFH